MRVVVAGSSGMIGSALVARLRAAGHEVVRLVRRAPSGPDERGWDPPAGRLDAGALARADAVVNLCGNPQQARPWSGAYKQALRDSRIVPTEVLAKAVAEHGVPTLVNASGTNFYGDTGSRLVDETAPPGTSGFLARLAQDWESATQAAADGGARVVRLRTGPVFAPRGGMLGPLRLLFGLGLGGRLGSGRQWMSFIALDDHVEAIRFLLEHDEISGPVNAVTPEPVTNAEFTRALGETLGRPTLLPAPAFGVRLVLGEVADELALVSIGAVPGVLDRAGFTFRRPTVREALAAATA